MSASSRRFRQAEHSRVRRLKDAFDMSYRVRPQCPVSGKRMFTLEVDVYLAFRNGAVTPRPYRCPDCGSWHASSDGQF